MPKLATKGNVNFVLPCPTEKLATDERPKPKFNFVVSVPRTFEVVTRAFRRKEGGEGCV